jgi:hypothetical protein
MGIKPDPTEIEAAMRWPNGWVYRKDNRVGPFKPSALIPPELIVGRWKVDSQGKITGEFIKNPNYDPTRWKHLPRACRGYVRFRTRFWLWLGCSVLLVLWGRHEDSSTVVQIAHSPFSAELLTEPSFSTDQEDEMSSSYSQEWDGCCKACLDSLLPSASFAHPSVERNIQPAVSQK